MEGSSNSAVGFDRENAMVPLSFEGDNSSVASINEGSESPLSSWDSEPETDIPSLINCDGASEGSLQSINLEENYLDMEGQNQFVGVENTDDGLLWQMDNRSYDELLKKFMEKEEEIIKLNVQVENSEAQLDNVRDELKLKEEELNKQKELSEQEIFKLKIQVENSEAQLDNVCEELNLKEEELNKQKELSGEEIFNLKSQIEKSENRLDKVQEELNLKAEKLQNQIAENAILKKELERKSTETHQLQGQLKVAQEKMVKSELKLLSNRKHIQMLADSVIMHESIAANDEQEVQKLKFEMLDLQARFSLMKDKLHFDIASLSKMKTELTSKLADCQSRNKELENKLSRDRDAKVEQEDLHATQQMVLEDEIKCLREELGQKMHLAEAANKELEMVVIERDAANAKIEKLDAEICSYDDTFKLYATQQKEKIKCLREELGQKMHLVEAANKKMEMAMIERDEANAKIDKLEAEICSNDDTFKLYATLEKEKIKCLRKELGEKMHLVEAANKKMEMVMIERDEANAKIDKLEAEICSNDDTFKLYATQQMVLQDEIKCLREELGRKMHLVEAANKDFEMVVIERNEANAKIDKLEAELCSCNGKLSDVEKYIQELKASLKKQLVNFETLIELVDNNKTNLNETSMLKLRVEELVKEVSRQKCVISDKDEEKREAIRQLCYSLEFYRSGYRELKLKEEQLIKQKELSKEEIFKLKIEIEKNENRLDNVREELNLKVEKLQKQIAKLDTHSHRYGITA